jgi:hypothetical protein
VGSWRNLVPRFAQSGFPRAILLALALALPGALFAQQFEPINALYFTRPFAAPDPLPQVLAIASTTTANFDFSVTPLSLPVAARGFPRHPPEVRVAPRRGGLASL